MESDLVDLSVAVQLVTKEGLLQEPLRSKWILASFFPQPLGSSLALSAFRIMPEFSNTVISLFHSRAAPDQVRQKKPSQENIM
jgi:hypothetical protein